ncbi:GNAT family N-acetyltransferase [Hymenobacter taeanensis]|uniref:GNAT family N-acetyltransferase n=1 Tax=Hymenobacter taeanensis TaxID=2735321 RepID=A0A6M6BLX3_9BACT|nr:MULTISPECIES: GNAT family N-acetyltransferase [Hymenobacter]QJX48982.1 GNAT family N-acetyltransferase [Hymenobacter taeanensis]UOQ81500.1 GNAT family N-acetyltransferase [Hymenobacter sp. 5414T-23]
MHLQLADLSDIDGVLALHQKYQIDTILEEDKKDGFVTTAFTREQLTQLIQEEQGLFIAKQEEQVVAYVMSASWQFWSVWPIFSLMIENLPNLEYAGRTLNTENSYQYGPVCVDKAYRGSGLLETIFEFAREKMSHRYPVLVTFINCINSRSYAAHTQKLGLEVIAEFDFNRNHYLELAYDTSKCLQLSPRHKQEPQQ